MAFCILAFSLELNRAYLWLIDVSLSWVPAFVGMTIKWWAALSAMGLLAKASVGGAFLRNRMQIEFKTLPPAKAMIFGVTRKCDFAFAPKKGARNAAQRKTIEIKTIITPYPPPYRPSKFSCQALNPISA